VWQPLKKKRGNKTNETLTIKKCTFKNLIKQRQFTKECFDENIPTKNKIRTLLVVLSYALRFLIADQITAYSELAVSIRSFCMLLKIASYGYVRELT
jgi:hypothetical protein